MKYSIYETDLDTVKKTSKGRRMLKDKWGKNVTYRDYASDALIYINQDLNKGVDV